MQFFENAVNTINTYLSDYILVFLLLGTGLYFTIRTKFVQVRCFKEGFKSMFGGLIKKGKKNDKNVKGVSAFQALTTAIAAQVGTGNIVGASGAILTGGPGAVFWMWIIAFFGMATIYAEAVLAQESRVVYPDGKVTGGPVHYIKRAFKGKFGTGLATFFAIAATIALGLIGGMVQSNAIGQTCEKAFHIPAWIFGLAAAIIAGIVFIGGVKRIAKFTEKLVPFMAILYIVLGLIIIIARIKFIPETFYLIFKYAFNPQAIIGGGFGSALKIAVSQGAKRGLFSNEAGMGSTPHAHALAEVNKPHDQGVLAMMGVFIDTFVVLTLTALIVISTLYADNGILSNCGVIPEGVNSSNMAQLAFGSVFGDSLGNILVAICLLFFAFSTIISWGLFGKINYDYLTRRKFGNLFFLGSITCVFLGSIFSNDLVWGLTDMFNQLMVIPNVITLFALSGLVIYSATGKYNGILNDNIKIIKKLRGRRKKTEENVKENK